MMNKRTIVSVALTALLSHGAFAQNVPEWVKEAVIYQVYPSSYMDSNADGIGDIQGVASRLDYIKSLGVNTIWFSPLFSSEFKDGGYDVSDFYSVDKRFGTNTELIKLVDQAHKKGMKVFLDLVAGHTSDQHPWFLQSKEAETNLHYSDYFIWTNDKGVLPKKFNKPKEAARQGNYMRNFFACQPALNYGFANPNPNNPWEQSVDAPGPQAVRRELKNIIAFWMDKGVDGFRVDMAASLIKNDRRHVETIKLWKEMRTWFETKYPEGVLLAEWSNPSESLKGGFHIDYIIHNGVPGYRSLFFNRTDKEKPHTCYFDRAGKGEVKEFVSNYTRELENTRQLGLISIPTGSHDMFRLCGWERNTPEQLKVAMTFLLTMPGAPIIYYGDEIGMKYIPGLPEKEGSISARNRGGSRTPMQWDGSINAGFSTASAEQLYLPIDSDKNFPNVAAQEKDPNSVLNHVRKLLELRKSSKALENTGRWQLVSDIEKPYPMVYIRQEGNERFCIVINPSDQTVETTFQSLQCTTPQLVFGNKKLVKYKSGKVIDKIKIKPISSAVYRLEN